MRTLTVDLDARSYPIHIGPGALSELPSIVAKLAGKSTVALVTDTNVGYLYGETIADALGDAGVKVIVSVIPAGEQYKRLSQVESLCGEFLDEGVDRSSVVVALGGGVVGDVVGYAAAAFMRGVKYVQVPTTIVAQVDSSVGGKTAVNHPMGKNIIGAFHQPSAVVIDLDVLKTLPERELRAGLAEVIKHGVIADEALFEHMEQQHDAVLARDPSALQLPIERSCEIKGAIVTADETEQGVRANLNYGHTFGHGIEAATRYTKFLHGEAIALGMSAAAYLAEDLGLVDSAFVERQSTCLKSYGLPVEWPELPVDDVVRAMKHDKKSRAGKLKFVVAEAMGRVVHRTDITPAQARKALERVCS